MQDFGFALNIITENYSRLFIVWTIPVDVQRVDLAFRVENNSTIITIDEQNKSRLSSTFCVVVLLTRLLYMHQ